MSELKTTNASKHVVPHNLLKFGLIKGKSFEPEMFLCNFVLGLSTHGLDIEEHWLRLLPGCLPDHDVTWFNANMSSSSSWAQAKQLFLEHVGHCYSQDIYDYTSIVMVGFCCFSTS